MCLSMYLHGNTKTGSSGSLGLQTTAPLTWTKRPYRSDNVTSIVSFSLAILRWIFVRRS